MTAKNNRPAGGRANEISGGDATTIPADVIECLADVRTIARRAREWIDVHASRTRPGSAYIPRRGDQRYE